MGEEMPVNHDLSHLRERRQRFEVDSAVLYEESSQHVGLDQALEHTVIIDPLA